MTPLCQHSLFSGGLITNYVCSSACAHCVYRSNPKRSRDTITADTAEKAFRKAMALGCRSMHIGGGEPFLNTDALLTVLQVARSVGMGIDYIETNSSWFKNPAQADELLRRLQKAGCHTLLISIDPFHNASVPLAKVKGVMSACRRTGMDIFPWRMEFFPDVDHFDDRTTHSMDEYKKAFGGDYLTNLAQRYGLNLGGRALATFRNCFEHLPLEDVLTQNQSGCSVLQNGSHFHIDLYGDFIPTKCPGLAVSLDDLGKPLPNDQYPTLNCLFNNGPAALLDRSRSYGFKPNSHYLSACDLCDHIRTFLVQQAPEDFPDLRPHEFYEESRVE